MEKPSKPSWTLSRRKFILKTGFASAAITGIPFIQTGCNDKNEKKTNDSIIDKGQLFVNKRNGLKDRIERVKIAALGMQRYDWEQGTLAQALLEIGEFDLVVSLARGAIMRQEKGRFSVLKGNGPISDCASVGEAVLFAGKYTGDPLFKKAADEMLEVIKTTNHKSTDGTIYHTQEPAKWHMSDFNYMLPPFLAAAGEFDLALKQIEGNRKFLYHPKEKLYSHIWDDSNEKFAREDFWGIGNGWTAAGLTRVIKMLPENMKTDRERLIGYVKDLVEGCLKYICNDGLFHNVLNDDSTFKEVNLSQMISYTIFRGIAAGYLDRSYLEKAKLMRKAANDRVDNLGYVQEVCGCPNFDRLYVAPEGQAFYLLMEAAASDFEKKESN
ncbi:MAG: glycoside hydrolase family 88 protein [Bacteroidales bacterium]